MELQEIKGIKNVREKLFNSMDIYTPYDLINYFPSKYFDLSREEDINLKESPKLVRAKLLSVGKKGYRNKSQVTAKAVCNGHEIDIIWFNQPYVYGKLKAGEEYILFGKCTFKERTVFFNPMYEKADSPKKLKGIMPIYRLCQGISQSTMANAVSELLKKGEIKSLIPNTLAQKYDLIAIDKAYRIIHKPEPLDDINKSAERIAVEILYSRLISLYFQGNTRQKRSLYYTEKKEVDIFLDSLDFDLTGGQRLCLDEILTDLNSGYVMNRLLQGDVGSGKTIVAFSAIYYAVKSGGQCAFIAPTEILAYQHYMGALKLFKPFGFDIEYLSGSIDDSQKKRVLFNLKNNVCDVVFATHSILSDDVEFAKLKLAVCDEQHRFGVRQRSLLKNKGDGCDILIMSATPLPRTLNLVTFGELSISRLSEKPSNRKEVKTHIVGENKIGDMYRFVRELVAQNKQVYIVTRSIEADTEDKESAKTLYSELRARELKGIKTGLLHGKMKDYEKANIMKSFAANEISVLISTTIIEVGIDVKNATAIIIYHSDKMGLAQLHQLRGRVGRGEEQSYCFLLYSDMGEDGLERLKALKSTQDGFELAEKDLQIRGAGDFIGLKQHGTPFSNIKNVKIGENVLKTALTLYKEAIQDKDYIESINPENLDGNYKDIILN